MLSYYFTVTKVQIEYELAHALSGADAAGVAAVHGCYGIMRVKLSAGLDRLTVDYDPFSVIVGAPCR